MSTNTTRFAGSVPFVLGIALVAVPLVAGDCFELTRSHTGLGGDPTTETVGIGEFWVPADVDLDYGDAINVFSADIDFDGDADLVGAGFAAGELRWWENSDGAGSSWVAHVVDTGVFQADWATAGDLDGDGDMDLVAAINGTGDLVWWKNLLSDGSSWERRDIDTAFGGAEAVTVGDVDGDGDADLTAVAWVASEVAWYENRLGTGQIWIKRRITNQFGAAEAVVNADIDGDLDLDVVAAGWARGVHWFENVDGRGRTWSRRAIADGGGQKASVWAADIDGDLDLDVLAGELSGDRVLWWENINGDGTAWVENEIDTAVDEPKSIAAADFDRDGDMDVYVAATGDGAVFWWENLSGDGSLWLEHVVTSTLARAWTAFAADLDADIDLDIAAVGVGDDEVRWFENRGEGICPPGLFQSGSLLALTAHPDPANGIAAWGGTDDDTLTSLRNFVTMPAAPASIAVDYASGCFDLVRVAFGPGGTASTTPSGSDGCLDGRFVAGEEISLVASPDPGAHVNRWGGSQVPVDTSQEVTNRVTMPNGSAGVAVQYSAGCFILRTVHAGNGGNPIPDPPNSPGCPAGQFRFETAVTVTATPDPGFAVGGWIGTDDDGSMQIENTVTIPDEARLTGVLYVPAAQQ